MAFSHEEKDDHNPEDKRRKGRQTLEPEKAHFGV